MNSNIRIENISAFYGDCQVLKNITLDIPEKQVTAIVGPSGCGKSTMLKCFNRLIDLVEGTTYNGNIFVRGMNLLSKNIDVNDVRRKVGLLPQKPTSLPMSIYDNVAYGLRVHGTKNKNILDEKVEHYLRVAGLWDEVKGRLKSPGSQLSIGQQQRLCLARGLAVEPDIILCDEPTSALDPISAQHIEQQLIKLKENYTIVIVTHNIHQAMRIADYVAYLYLGELVEHGPAKEIFENPKDERTRAYIGGTYLNYPKTDKEIILKRKRCPTLPGKRQVSAGAIA